MLGSLHWAIAVLFLVGSMVGIGLQVGRADLARVVRAKGLILKSLLANFVILPAIGWLLTMALPMSPATRNAFIILSCSPGGVSALQFTSKRRDVLAYAGALGLVLAALSVVLSPALIALSLPKDVVVAVSYGRAIGLVAMLMLLPLAVGVIVHDGYPVLSARLARPIALIGTLAFVVFVAVTLSTRQAAIGAHGADVIVAMLGFIAASIGIGWLLGGPDGENRAVLASATSMRNVMLGLAIVEESFPNEGIELPLIAFSALMVPPNFIVAVAGMVLNRRWRTKPNALRT